MSKTLTPEQVAVEELKPHPRNYKQHPDDQLDHIIASINETGFYRNIVIAEDGTILAGHGVVQAAKKMGMDTVPAIRLPLPPDDPRAIKVMVGDNEIGKLAEVDDHLLVDLLGELLEFDDTGLLGSGFDENMLKGLDFLTAPPVPHEETVRSAEEEWGDAGVAGYDSSYNHPRAVVTFDDHASREKFTELLGVTIIRKGSRNRDVISFAWPPVSERNDFGSVKFESAGSDEVEDAEGE